MSMRREELVVHHQTAEEAADSEIDRADVVAEGESA